MNLEVAHLQDGCSSNVSRTQKNFGICDRFSEGSSHRKTLNARTRTDSDVTSSLEPAFAIRHNYLS